MTQSPRATARIAAAIVLGLSLATGSLLQTQTPGFSVAITTPSPLPATTAARRTTTRFTVTNHSSSRTYIRILRQQVTGPNGREVLGIPSPEIGLTLGPGESGPMWFRWDLDSTSPGTYTADVPFQSELTEEIVRVPITVVMTEAPSRPVILMGTVTRSDGTPLTTASVQITDVMSTSANRTNPLTVDSRGAFAVTRRPSRYAVRVDADGYSGQTQFAALDDRTVNLSFALERALYHVIDATTTIVNLDQSIWEIGGSADLSQVATAPMTHNGAGRFFGIAAGPSNAWQQTWSLSHPAMTNEKRLGAGPYQAMDEAISVSADGSLAAGMDWNGNVYLIDQPRGTTRWLTDRAGDVNPLYPSRSPYATGFYTAGATAFSADGTMMAAGGSNGTLVAFSTATGDVRWRRSFSGEIRALRFSDDGTRLGVGSGDWMFHWLDAANGDSVWTGSNDFWSFFFIAMNPSASLVGTGGKSGIFTLWNAGDGSVKWRKEFPDGPFVTGGGITPDGDRVMLSDWNYGVHYLDGAGNPLWFQELNIAAAAMTSDGQFVFAAGHLPGQSRPSLVLFDRTGTRVWRYDVDTAVNCAVTISPFQPSIPKSVRVASSTDGRTMTGVMGCIGGSVFRASLTVGPV